MRVELPCRLIQRQLASGRVAVESKTFQAAIPEKYRQFFVVDPTETPVLLPLQEVLKNLPETALKMRTDQEKAEAVDCFETPFSVEAKKDERRLGRGAPGGWPDRPKNRRLKPRKARKLRFRNRAQP